MKKRQEIALRVVLLAVIVTLAVAPALLFVPAPQVASAANLLTNGDLDSGSIGGNATGWDSTCTSGVSSGAYYQHPPSWESDLFGHTAYYVHTLFYCTGVTDYKIFQPNVYLTTGVYSYTVNMGCDGGDPSHNCYFDADMRDDLNEEVDGSLVSGVGTYAQWDLFTNSAFSVTVAGNYTFTVALHWQNGETSAMFDGADLERISDLAGPTPVPTASPLPPQATACVNATAIPSATLQATPTVFNLTPQPTGTRTPTPTPGGPTATPNPSASGTPSPQFDSGMAQFVSSLSPWTVVVDAHYLGTFTTTWQSDNGPDNLPGIAYLRDYIGWLEPTPAVFTYTAPITGALVYGRSQGFDFPLRVVGQAKWAEATLQGEKPYIRVWYFDPDYEGVGQGAWIMAPPDWIAVDGSAWRSFGYTLTQHGGSGRITAVAITEEIVDVVNVDHLGVQLDNLRIFSGPLAVANSFPVCAGSGGSGRPPIAMKQCVIKSIVVDVYASCIAPTDPIDVVGWIGYYFCRLWRYFSFNADNRQQIADIGSRQNANEPIGTLNEMNDSFGVLYDTLSSIASVYNSNDYYTIDWSMLTAPWSFDLSNITAGWHASPTPIDQQEVLRACPAYIANMNAEIQKSACFVIWVIKVKMRFWIFFQYALDVSAIIWALSAINEWVGKHG